MVMAITENKRYTAISNKPGQPNDGAENIERIPEATNASYDHLGAQATKFLGKRALLGQAEKDRHRLELSAVQDLDNISD
jgi:hypothetical protein